MVLAVAALCLPNPNGDFHFVDEIVSLEYSVRKLDSNFNSQDKPVSSPQPVNPSFQPATVANLLHENQIPQINKIQKTISLGDRGNRVWYRFQQRPNYTLFFVTEQELYHLQ